MRSSTNCSSRLRAAFIIGFVLTLGCAQTKRDVKKEQPAERGGTRIAVFPFDNVSGTQAPLKELRKSLINGLKANGLQIVDAEDLEKFMTKYRVRFTGGLDSQLAGRLKDSTGADAALITSLELYRDLYPPKIGLTSRLVSTEGSAEILWIDSVGLSGDESPGLLKLGLVKDPAVLSERALDFLASSLSAHLSGEVEKPDTAEIKNRYQPKVYYRSQLLQPSIRFLAPISAGEESAKTAALPVSLSIASDVNVTVEYTVTGGTATGKGVDYTLSKGFISFSPGETEKSIEIVITGDAFDEDDETIEVTLSNPGNAVLREQTVHTFTIIDDDPEPEVQFHTLAQGVSESSGTAVITTRLSSASGRTVTVPYAVSRGNASADAGDYTLKGELLSFSPGEVENIVEIDIIDDARNEDDETITFVLGTPTNASIGIRGKHELIIYDDDPEPVVSFAKWELRGEESSSPVIFDVTLSAESGRAVTVTYGVTGGDAAGGGVDFTLPGGTLIFAPGDTKKTIEMSIYDDSLNEDDESVDVAIKSVTNAIKGDISIISYQIADNDPRPDVTFTSSGQTISENAGIVPLVVALSAVSGRDITVPFTIKGTAVDPDDYTVTESPLVISAGEMLGVIALTIGDDDYFEEDETVEVTVSPPVNADMGIITQHTVTIRDNDPEPSVSLGPVIFKGGGEGSEGNVVDITVELSSVSAKDVSVLFSLGGIASLTDDYRITESPIVIPPGEKKGTITLTVLDDDIDEEEETVEISLGTPTNALLGRYTFWKMSISDDDPKPSINFSRSILNVSEDGGSIPVNVILSAASGRDVTISCIVSGTAAFGADYLFSRRDITIKPGELMGEAILSIVDDTEDEIDETIDLSFLNPENAIPGETDYQMITIADNDDAPTIAVVPFLNRSDRKYAGEIIGLHFIKNLMEMNKFTVVEPGIIRDGMLKSRMIMDYGLSFANADLIFDKIYNADLILTGYVWDYQESGGTTGNAKVDFSVVVFERTNREMVWSSRSYNTGNEKVFFFDWGKVNVAQKLAKEMARAVVTLMTQHK
jgi:TolB-like protein